jgi:DNA polymerase III delta subunit
MKKTNQNLESNWQKVYVYTGDDYISRIYILFDGCIEEKFDSTTSIAKIQNTLQGINLYGSKRVVKLYNPNYEQLKTINDILNSSKMTIDGLQVYCCNDSLDGRSGFASKAKSFNRIFHYGQIEVSKYSSKFQNFINDWLSSNKAQIQYDALNWLIDNAPTVNIKVKVGASKKDVLVYDLPLITNEIKKLIDIDCLNISIEDLKQLDFYSQEKDIFAFIESCMSSDTNAILKGLYALNESHGHQAVLMIFLSQLFFYLNVSGLLEEKKYDNKILIDEISLHPYVKKYLDTDYKEISQEINLKSINPVRLDISKQQLKANSAEISVKINSVLSAVIDLRNNLSERIVFPYLAICISSNKIYTPMSYNIFK